MICTKIAVIHGLLFLLGGGKGSCRFCGTTANTSLLAIGSVCTDPECLERSDVVCDKTLPCGHACCGVKGEEKCLPCLNGCAGDDSKLKQDAEDMCMMCYTEGLAYAACIQVTTCTCIYTKLLILKLHTSVIFHLLSHLLCSLNVVICFTTTAVAMPSPLAGLDPESCSGSCSAHSAL